MFKIRFALSTVESFGAPDFSFETKRQVDSPLEKVASLFHSLRNDKNILADVWEYDVVSLLAEQVEELFFYLSQVAKNNRCRTNLEDHVPSRDRLIFLLRLFVS